MFFSNSQQAFLNPAWRHAYEEAGSWPSDAEEVSLPLESEIREALARKAVVTLGGGGIYVEEYERTKGDIAADLAAVKMELRIVRDKILTRVVDIGAVASATGNASLVAEAFSEPDGVRRKLLDITDDQALNNATTREEMNAAVLAYYQAIVANVSPELRSAFKELEK